MISQQLRPLVNTDRTSTLDETQHKQPFNSPFSGTTRVSRYQKGKTNLDFTEARDSEWQWHQLGHMQVCTSLQTDNHASTPPLSFSQAGCPSCCPTNSVKALKVIALKFDETHIVHKFLAFLTCLSFATGHIHTCTLQRMYSILFSLLILGPVFSDRVVFYED